MNYRAALLICLGLVMSACGVLALLQLGDHPRHVVLVRLVGLMSPERSRGGTARRTIVVSVFLSHSHSSLGRWSCRTWTTAAAVATFPDASVVR